MNPNDRDNDRRNVAHSFQANQFGPEQSIPLHPLLQQKVLGKDVQADELFALLRPETDQGPLATSFFLEFF